MPGVTGPPAASRPGDGGDRRPQVDEKGRLMGKPGGDGVTTPSRWQQRRRWLVDLHTLLTRPGTDVHVLELAGAGHAEHDTGTLLDATARAAYRRRLSELDRDLDTARADHDTGRAER